MNVLCVLVFVLVWWTAIPDTRAQVASGSLRLVGRFENTSPGLSAGRLEIFLDGNWGTVCADGFDFYEGDLACQELGFLYADNVGTVGVLGFDEGTGPILLDDVICSTASDSRLVECSRASFTSCVHFLDVALRCSNTVNQLRLVSQTNRTTDLSAGRLEIFINDQWGTVCDDGFDIRAASVACRQMGFIEAVSFGTADLLGYQTDLSSPIWLDDVDCSLNFFFNNNLRLCSHVGTEFHNCRHSEDVILSCLAEGNLRLVNIDSFGNLGALVSSGRLEIYWNSQWGTICDDGFTGAETACRQLGYANVIDYGSDLGFPRAATAAPIWLDDVVDCRSDDLTLLSCEHSGIGVHNCGHSEDIGLICGSTSSTPSISDTDSGDDNFPTTAVIVAAVVVGFLFFVCIPVCAVCAAVFHRNKNGNRSSRRSRNVAVPPRTTVVTTTTNPITAPPAAQFPYPRQPQQAPPPHPTNQGPSEYPPPIPGASDLQEAPPPSYSLATAYPPPSYPAQPTSQYPPQAPPPQAQYHSQAPPPQVPYPPQAPYPPQNPAYPQTQTTSFTAPYPTAPQLQPGGQSYPPEAAPSAPPL